MMTAITTARQLDWSGWLIGIVRSFIGGGAGAAAGALGPMATDSDHFNLGSGLHHTLISMGVSFLIVGLGHMLIFLQTHSVPEPWTGVDRRQNDAK
jgi:hypothetical protein